MSGPFVDQATDARNWYLADISRSHDTATHPPPVPPLTYHRSSLGGKDITIHVLDSGGNVDTKELPSHRAVEIEKTGDDHKADIDEPKLARIHGTTVAALAAGGTRGVAPEAKVKFWRVSRVAAVGSLSIAPIAVASASAINQIVADHDGESHLHVINCSWGALTLNNQNLPARSLLRTAVERALKKGFLIVAAAGNDGKEIIYSDPNDPLLKDKPTTGVVYPACIPGVLTVGAYDYNDKRDRASFSAHGSPVDIYAPGVNMPEMDLAESTGQGTSYAAPLVSGVAACILAEHQRDRLAAMAKDPSKQVPVLSRAELVDRIMHETIVAADQRRLLWWGPLI